jgi:hypothetical protein
MSGSRPHNPIIDILAAIGVIAAAGLLCTGLGFLLTDPGEPAVMRASA